VVLDIARDIDRINLKELIETTANSIDAALDALSSFIRENFKLMDLFAIRKYINGFPR